MSQNPYLNGFELGKKKNAWKKLVVARKIQTGTPNFSTGKSCASYSLLEKFIPGTKNSVIMVQNFT